VGRARFRPVVARLAPDGVLSWWAWLRGVRSAWPPPGLLCHRARRLRPGEVALRSGRLGRRGCNARPCRATTAQRKFGGARASGPGWEVSPGLGRPRLGWAAPAWAGPPLGRTRRPTPGLGRHARARGSGRAQNGPKGTGRPAVGTRARPKSIERGLTSAPNGMSRLRPGRTARLPRAIGRFPARLPTSGQLSARNRLRTMRLGWGRLRSGRAEGAGSRRCQLRRFRRAGRRRRRDRGRCIRARSADRRSPRSPA
jgi:hypothetical protein